MWMYQTTNTLGVHLIASISGFASSFASKYPETRYVRYFSLPQKPGPLRPSYWDAMFWNDASQAWLTVPFSSSVCCKNILASPLHSWVCFFSVSVTLCYLCLVYSEELNNFPPYRCLCSLSLLSTKGGGGWGGQALTLFTNWDPNFW